MTIVTPEDRDAMIRLKAIMEGKTPEISQESSMNSTNYIPELAGTGQVTTMEVNAMADVLNRFNKVSNQVVDTMITESATNPEIGLSLNTERTPVGVKIGRYQILIKEDAKRLAGKQYYSIYNSLTNDTIADDISLYETAIAAVRLLNGGKFANSADVRKLFEADDTYTSHRIDALVFKRKVAKAENASKRNIFEDRYQASLDRAMMAKKLIKTLAG
jgi:hypothetical protein